MPNQHYRPQKRRPKKKRRNPMACFWTIITRTLKRNIKILKRMVLKKTGGFKGFLKLAAIVGLAGIALFAIVGIGTIAYFSRDLPDPNKLIDRQIAQSTKIYDRTGETLLYEISGDEKRTIIKLEDLPEYIPQALIALEDKTFYHHSGFNYQRLAKAVIFKLLRRSDGGGASTLTSQLVKNAILTPERTVSRKLKEFILVFQIERKFSKDQILQLYFNEIPYGSTAYGVEAASNFYFDKSATDLTLAQSALLASIIQRPTYYSPYGSNRDKLLNRKDLTLSLMQNEGYITEEEKKLAQEEELVFRERREAITAPHFVFYVREQLTEKYGEYLVNQGGLQVITTLDLEKQTLAEDILKEKAEGNLDRGASNAALVSLDPTNGEILAMVGSVDYFNEEIDGNVNVTTRPRQPGSSFKPIVYTLGWARGFPPSAILFDVLTTFPGSGKNYEPKNYDLKERGPISMRKALQGSLNIPAVKMLYLLGVENVLDFAEDLGYTTFADRSRFGLSLVLGGGEVTLLEHTAAFATFANDGMHHKPLAIMEVKTTNGTTLDTFESKGKRAIDENVARITNNVLSDNQARAYAFGLSSPLTLGGRPVAAKTGTTNDYRDAWTMGYTPSLATGVWVGNNDFSKMNRGAGGSTLAAPIWQAFMRKALEGTEVESFGVAKIPAGDKPVLTGQGFGLQKISIDRASGKLATPRTPDTFREDKLYVNAHTILHYIFKANPLGPGPADPASADGQYQKWEDGVQAWVQARISSEEPLFESLDNQALPKDIEIVYGLPPTEEDDLHVQANQPKISLISPQSNIELTTRSIRAEVSASAPRGISRVEYYVDSVLVGTVASDPYQLTASLKNFPNGFYTLRAIAYDDIDNRAETIVRFQLQSSESYVKTSWVEPTKNTTLTLGENISLAVSIDSPEKVNQITFFAVDSSTNEETLLDAVVAPSSSEARISWTPTLAGNFRVFVKSSVEGFGVLAGPSLTITVAAPPEKEEEASN